MAAPVVIPLVKRFAKYRRRMIWVGCMASSLTLSNLHTRTDARVGPLCLLGLVAGSFARSLATLIFTQGIVYGTGFIIFYYPILSMVNEFWITRRGMAYGLLCSASGVSGAAMPFCIEALLQRYGYPTTLRAIAVGLFVLTGPLIPFLKGRTPEPEVGAGPGRTDWSFLKTGLFWKYSMSNFAMGLGYFYPFLYLPSYASAKWIRLHARRAAAGHDEHLAGVRPVNLRLPLGSQAPNQRADAIVNGSRRRRSLRLLGSCAHFRINGGVRHRVRVLPEPGTLRRGLG